MTEPARLNARKLAASLGAVPSRKTCRPLAETSTQSIPLWFSPASTASMDLRSIATARNPAANTDRTRPPKTEAMVRMKGIRFMIKKRSAARCFAWVTGFPERVQSNQCGEGEKQRRDQPGVAVRPKQEHAVF